MALKMKSYFGKKRGVRVSVGESLLRSKALTHFIKRLKEEGIYKWEAFVWEFQFKEVGT